MARLEVERLCKGWSFPVIDELSLAVEEGEFFVIVGASGIGKTTLLRLISGLETPRCRTGHRRRQGPDPPASIPAADRDDLRELCALSASERP